MARRARLVIPGLPHYILQSGCDDRQIFFDKDDADFYRDLLAKRCAASGLQILSYCFMPDEIHILAVPLYKDSLRKAIGDANRQYARRIKAEGKCDGPLWADRFHSCPVQEKYTHHVVHLIEWLPVLAGEAKYPHQWHYSSARTRHYGLANYLLTDHPCLEEVDWERVESKKPSYIQMDLIYSHQSTGRPLGDRAFIESLEQEFGHRLRPRKRGRRPRALSLSNALDKAMSGMAAEDTSSSASGGGEL